MSVNLKSIIVKIIVYINVYVFLFIIVILLLVDEIIDEALHAVDALIIIIFLCGGHRWSHLWLLSPEKGGRSAYLL